jgi:hypothetical protein
MRFKSYGGWAEVLALVTTACLLGGNAEAAECSLRVADQEHIERVWPALSQITISGVLDAPVTLQQGQYEGPPFVADGQARPQLRLWPEMMVRANLDGIAGDVNIGLLSETSGGSGERVYLVAATPVNGRIHAWPAALLGDRIKVRTLQVRGQQIFIEIIEAGPDQPLCCGTQITQLVWQLDRHGLVLKDRRPQGQLSIDTMQGKHWYLLDRPGDGLNALHPSCIEMQIHDNQVSWKVGGQSYSARLDEPSPGQIAVSDLMPGMQAGELQSSPEGSLISRLMSVNRYTFRAGRLLLMGQDGQRLQAFEFADDIRYPQE